MPWPPAFCTNSAVSSIVSGRLYSERCVRVVRPVTYTVAPAAPNSTAMPRPAPRVPPATNATLSFSTRLIVQLSLARFRLELTRNYSLTLTPIIIREFMCNFTENFFFNICQTSRYLRLNVQ